MIIVDLTPEYTESAAALLVEGFREHSPKAWLDMDSARETVREVTTEGNIMRMALDDAGALLGWIAGAPQYDGHVWELHPLVVSPEQQRRGIGRALVFDFEERVRERDGITIMLGTDDEDNRTTLSNVDLYDETWRRIRDVRNPGGHPLGFYQKLGYAIIGVVPDANGIGKPDILMAKRVGT
jgi:aminoglycoside 6'-N-acetyltransferase I